MSEKRYVAGVGFVDTEQEPADLPSDTEPQTDEDAYQAQREVAQMERVSASMDRAMGRRPDSLLSARRHRSVLGDDVTRTDNHYDAMER